MNVKELSENIKHNTWLIVLLGIFGSFVIPKLGLSIKPYLSYLLMFLMFLSCLDLKLGEIIVSLKEYKKQFLVLAIIHLASPLAVLLLRPFIPSDEIFLGLVLASAIPAGRSAVFLANIYGGEPMKALVVTTMSNALSPILVPLVVWSIAKTSIKINVTEMGSTIVFLVVVPIVAAFLFGKTAPGKTLNKYSVSISVLTLFLIIMGIIAPIRMVVLDHWVQSIVLGALIAFLICFDFLLGYLVGGKKEEQITYALSAGYKNYTLATLLALTLFNPIVALPSIVYTVVNNLLLIPLQLFLTKK